MAYIVRCDICQSEVEPEKAYHTITRYWDGKPTGGMLKELQFDLCPDCYPHFLRVIENMKEHTRNLVEARHMQW